jgi:hypothetical protein
MGIISDLLNFKPGGKRGATVADVEKSLARLAVGREAAQASISTILNQRRDALLADASDDAIAKLDAEADGHRLSLERFDLAEPELLAQLQNLRSAARRARWAELQRRRMDADRSYAVALRAAVDAFESLIRVSDDALNEGYASELGHSFATPPRIIDRVLCDAFEAEAERLREAVAGIVPVANPAPAIIERPKVARQQSPLQHKVYLDQQPEVGPPKKREPIRETARDGEVLVSVMRAGYESPSGKQCLAGDVVAMPIDMAKTAVRNGAVTYAEAEASV